MSRISGWTCLAVGVDQFQWEFNSGKNACWTWAYSTGSKLFLVFIWLYTSSPSCCRSKPHGESSTMSSELALWGYSRGWINQLMSPARKSVDETTHLPKTHWEIWLCLKNNIFSKDTWEISNCALDELLESWSYKLRLMLVRKLLALAISWMYRLATKWRFLLKIGTEGESWAFLFFVRNDHKVTKLFRLYKFTLTSSAWQTLFSFVTMDTLFQFDWVWFQVATLISTLFHFQTIKANFYIWNFVLIFICNINEAHNNYFTNIDELSGSTVVLPM